GECDERFHRASFRAPRTRRRLRCSMIMPHESCGGGTMLRAFVVVVLACAAAHASAQQFPAKPIRLLTTVTGGTDGLVRAVVGKAGEALGQPFVVEAQT